jgi:surface antigen
MQSVRRRTRARFKRCIAPIVAVIGLVAGGIVAATAPAMADTSLCSGTDWSVCVNQGYTDHGYGSHDGTSYWGADTGHNCTNYVAYVESTVNGAPSPGNDLGNASQWATNAAAKRIPVDSTPGQGSVAQWNANYDGASSDGHVAYVESVNSDGSITISEDNASSGPFDWKTITKTGGYWPSNFIHFKDLASGPPAQPDNLAFINAQYYSGNTQVVAYSQSSNYTVTSQIDVTGAGNFSTPNVVPLFNPKNGDLCFVNTTYYTGLDQLNCYSEASNYATLDKSITVPYSNNGTYNPYIIPEFEPDGDLAFIYTQYYQGQVQVVAYSMASNYQTASQIDETDYSDYTNTAVIIPQFEGNGDLAFINLQYYTGQVQVVAYSMASSYTTLTQNDVTAYDDVPTASLGTIFPMFNGSGNDLSFVNLNYYSGQVQVVSYSQSSNFTTVDMNDVTNYPDTTNPPVYPLLERLSS